MYAVSPNSIFVLILARVLCRAAAVVLILFGLGLLASCADAQYGEASDLILVGCDADFCYFSDWDWDHCARFVDLIGGKGFVDLIDCADVPVEDLE